MVPIPPRTELSKQYQDKYLWLSHGGGDLSAIRWVYAAGRGWCSVSIMDDQKDLRPLILKYRADGLRPRAPITRWRWSLGNMICC